MIFLFNRRQNYPQRTGGSSSFALFKFHKHCFYFNPGRIGVCCSDWREIIVLGLICIVHATETIQGLRDWCTHADGVVEYWKYIVQGMSSGL